MGGFSRSHKYKFLCVHIYCKWIIIGPSSIGHLLFTKKRLQQQNKHKKMPSKTGLVSVT
jgi:hypothetical protein